MYNQFRKKLINIWLIQLEFKIQFVEKNDLIIYGLTLHGIVTPYSDIDLGQSWLR